MILWFLLHLLCSVFLHCALLFFLYTLFAFIYVHYLEGIPLLVPSNLYSEANQLLGGNFSIFYSLWANPFGVSGFPAQLCASHGADTHPMCDLSVSIFAAGQTYFGGLATTSEFGAFLGKSGSWLSQSRQVPQTEIATSGKNTSSENTSDRTWIIAWISIIKIWHSGDF